jgi:hypothetical protein
MTLFARHVSVLCLLGFACLVVNTEARAQSQGEGRKRAFAELLARKAKAMHAAELRREKTAAHHVANAHPVAKQTAGAASLAKWTPALQRVENQATGNFSASPLVPSGFGSGRDAFVNSLYPAILGRVASQSELDYWAGILSSGKSPNVVATLLWRSQEHRAELRAHTSPGVPYNIAYRYSLFIGDQAGRLGTPITQPE